ncbi:hypothetical protein GUJ93_ZPchr0004g39147 [Zizania palustris]|uniref:DNA-binding protein S1FA n=1 Tax=Zizania palustris TaxID=103762 RepID=A0A8J5VY88_ZIZPA|nr:hypothetical protein GUJ93_ZPchr0004g39147 [Zizania palustris]
MEFKGSRKQCILKDNLVEGRGGVLVRVSGQPAAAMADQFADSTNNVVIEEVSKGLNPGMIVLLVVATFLLLFFVGNYALYVYAQKTLPPRKKKPVSKKKMKREKLKQGVSAPGE